MKLHLKKNAMLAAIIANPAKNTPRLKYAAMLEDNGDKERGEFIRLQIDLHKTVPHDPTLKPKRDREQVLLNEHGKQWETEVFEDADGKFDPGVKKVGFSRGFPESCSTTADAYITRGAHWNQRTPLREVSLLAIHGHAEQFAACPHASVLSRLAIKTNDFNDDDMTAVASSPHLNRLTSFTVSTQGYGDPRTQFGHVGLSSLAAAAFLPYLTNLSIASSPLK